MVAAINDGHNVSEASLPAKHYVLVGQTNDEVASRDEGAVAVSIPLVGPRVGVVRSAVDLDDEPAAEEKIDASDARDEHLSPNPDAAPPKAQADQRLRSGLACTATP